MGRAYAHNKDHPVLSDTSDSTGCDQQYPHALSGRHTCMMHKKPSVPPIQYTADDRRYHLSYCLAGHGRQRFNAVVLALNPEAARQRLSRHVPAVEIEVEVVK
jgi:hypothetical protein